MQEGEPWWFQKWNDYPGRKFEGKDCLKKFSVADKLAKTMSTANG